jgi:hypothetical protein
MAKICLVEASDSLIKVAEADVDIGKFSIPKIGIAGISSISEYPKKLFNLLKTLGIELNQMVLSIPRSKLSVHYLSLPATNPEEIKEMAKFQALKQLPYSKGEVLHSFRIIKKEGNNTKIMLVVARKEMIDLYLEPLKSEKIEPNAITIDSLGIVNWIKNRQMQGENQCIIDLDYKATNVCILSRGEFIFSREVNKGIEILSKDASEVDDLILEIQRSISAYNKENIGPSVNKIILTGATSNIDNFREILANRFSATIDIISSREGVDMGKVIKIGEGIEESNISFTKLIGFLRSSLEFEINLMPSEIVKKRAKQQALRTFITNFIYISFFVFGIISIFWWEYHRQDIYVIEAKRKLRELNKRIQLLDRKRKVINITLKHIKRQSSLLGVLRELYTVAPDNIVLKTFDYRKGRILINGITVTLDDVVKFIEKMQTSPIFRNVIQKYARQSRNKEEVTFQIEAGLRE